MSNYPIILALITFFFWGIGDIFGTISSRKIGAFRTTFWVCIAGIILFSPIALAHLSDFQNLSIGIVVLTFFIGVFDVFGNFSFNLATKLSSASLTGTLAGSFAAITTILSVIFLHEKLNVAQLLSIILIFIGIILVTLKFKEIKRSYIFQDPGVKWAIASMISWGVFFTFVKVVIGKIGWFWPIYFPFFLFPIFGFLKEKGSLSKNTMQPYMMILIICLSALLLRSGDLLFNLGIMNGKTSVIAPIAGSYPILYTIIAFFVFKEKLSKQQLIGITCTLISISTLAYYS